MPTQQQAQNGVTYASGFYNQTMSKVSDAKSKVSDLQTQHDSDVTKGYDATHLSHAQDDIDAAYNLLYGVGDPKSGGCDQDMTQAGIVFAGMNAGMMMNPPDYNAVLMNASDCVYYCGRAWSKIDGDNTNNYPVWGYRCLALKEMRDAEFLGQTGVDPDAGR